MSSSNSRVIFTKSLTEKPPEEGLEPIEGKLSRVHRCNWKERPTGVLCPEDALRTVNSSEFKRLVSEGRAQAVSSQIQTLGSHWNPDRRNDCPEELASAVCAMEFRR